MNHLAISLSRKCSRNIRNFHVSKVSQIKIMELVPPLGESITEGSISKWTKDVGDRIEVDDVVVIVETDKVTVDIKSTHVGILSKKIAHDLVIVGKELYEIDTDVSAVSITKKDSVAPIASIEATKPSQKLEEKSITQSHRIPLIKFIGKRSHEKKTSVAPLIEKVVPQTVVQKPTRPQTGVDFYTLKGGAFYGRAILSQKESDAIESGGASICL